MTTSQPQSSDHAARTRADLIAIATRGSGGMSRFVFGSVADKVTRKSSTSLLFFIRCCRAPAAVRGPLQC